MNNKLEKIYNEVLKIRTKYNKIIIILEIICITLICALYYMHSYSLKTVITLFIFVPSTLFSVLKTRSNKAEETYIIESILSIISSYESTKTSAEENKKEEILLKKSKLLSNIKYESIAVEKMGKIDGLKTEIGKIRLKYNYPELSLEKNDKNYISGIYFKTKCSKKFDGYTILTNTARMDEEEIKLEYEDFYKNYIIYGNNPSDTNYLVDENLRKALLKMDNNNIIITFENEYMYIFNYSFFDYTDIEETNKKLNEMLFIVSELNKTI